MFLSLFAQDAADRSPWGSFWFRPVPFKGGAENVTPDTALQLTAVFACVRILAEGVASLPFQLRYPKDGGRGWMYDEKHWLYRLFAKRPNQFQNPFEFREMMQGHLTLRGNAYAQIVAGDRGEVTDLLPRHPDSMTVDMLDNGSWRYRYRKPNGEVQVLRRDEVFHVRGLSTDGVMGINPIAAARESIAVGLAAQAYGARFFQNDGRPGGWIEHPGQFKDADARDNFRNAWQRQQAGANRGKTAVLEFGMKYHEVGVTNDDAQFLETRGFQVAEIARLFRVPPHLIGDLSKATFSNIEQQSIDYVMHTLTPWLVRWEQAIEFTFLDPEAVPAADVEFPTRELLRGDMAARANYYGSGILDGWLTRNEARLDDGREPIDGLDEPLVPLNMVGADHLNDAAEVEAATGALPDKPPAPSQSARTVALAQAACARVARKEARIVATVPLTSYVGGGLAEAYAPHVNFVAAVLGVNRAQAAAYADTQVIHLIEHGPEGIEDIARERLLRLALGSDE